MARMQQDQITLETPVQFIKGVGPSRAKSFGELGVETVGDLHIRKHRLLLISLSKIDGEGFSFNPQPETTLKKGDIMIVVGEHSMINEFRLFIHKRLR